MKYTTEVQYDYKEIPEKNFLLLKCWDAAMDSGEVAGLLQTAPEVTK